MFINFTNHPSNRWGSSQISAAEKYGEIADMPFPAVDPAATSEEIKRLADEKTAELVSLAPTAVLCQGEMSLCFAMTSRLKNAGIKVLCATTERKIKTVIDKNGEEKEVPEFCFVQFREYL